FSTTFAVGSSTDLASAIFSTSGFCFSAFGASLTPCVILDNSSAETISTGKASLGGLASGLAASDQTLHSNTAAWAIADMVVAVLIYLLALPWRPLSPSPRRRGESPPPRSAPSLS